MDKFNYLKEQLTVALATWQQTNGAKTTVGWMHAANPEVIAALLAELAAKDKRIAELEAKTAMTMGVGSGNGNLFVHGDYDSIKAAQAIVLENESLRAKLATPVRLPRPACTYADHSYPAYSRKQVEEIITSSGMCFTIEGDE